MPRLEEALYSYLCDDPGVSGFVDDRIWPHPAPGTPKLPYISWNRIGAVRIYTYDSYADTSAFVRARIQYNTWATTPLEAIDVGEALLLALSGYEGDMAGMYIGASFAVMELDTYDSAAKLHRRVMDFAILYEDDLVVSS